MSSREPISGPCVVMGESAMFSDVPYYFNSNGDTLDENYLFSVLGDPKMLCVIPVEYKKTYIEQRHVAKETIDKIEKDGLEGFDVIYIHRE